VADAADARGLPSFAEYCRLREAGRRKLALTALRRFLDEARARPETERRGVAAWMARVALGHPDVHHLHVHPLWSELVDPTLESWATETDGHEPRRLLALRRSEPELLRRVLDHDPADHACRAALAVSSLRAVDYACHHLGEGRFLGDEAAALAALRDAKEHLAKLPPGAAREELEQWQDRLHQFIGDWMEFRTSGTGTFREWCDARGREHPWTTNHYFVLRR